MLLPFTTVISSSTDFEGRFFPTLVNDTIRDNRVSRALFLGVSDNKIGYVLCSEGSIAASALFFVDDSGNIKQSDDFEPLFSEKLRIYLLNADDEQIFLILRNFLSSPVSEKSVGSTSELFDLLAEIAKHTECEDLICFRHGNIMNTVRFTNGSFTDFVYYNTDLKAYVTEQDSVVFGAYLSSLDVTKPQIFCKTASLKPSAETVDHSSLFRQKNIVITSAYIYFDVLSAIIKSLAGTLGDTQTKKLSEQLFAFLQKKYHPLFSALQYSDDNHDVNWASIINERKFISEQYRYESYHCYLDELLKLFFKSALELLETDAVQDALIAIDKVLKDKNDKETSKQIRKLLNQQIKSMR